MKDVKAVILAAGIGTRMKTEKPKVLHEVGGKTLLGRVIDSLRAAGIKDVTAVVGYKAEIIESSFKDGIKFVRQPKLIGSGDALERAVEKMPTRDIDILVTCGDTPLISGETYAGILRTHRKEKAACTVLTCEIENPYAYGRIVRDKKGEVLGIVEEKDAGAAVKKIKEVNVGTYCFALPLLARFIKDIEINEKKKEFYLTDMVAILKKNGKIVTTANCGRDEMKGINNRKDLAEANRIINTKSLDKLMESGVTIVDPANTYIHESAIIGKDTVIFPNTVIEADVTVAEGCKIGPFARLRPGTVLEAEVEVGNFVELCRSRIGARTKVKHHTYLGDTVVGKDVNIGAGTITANYDGKNKNRTIIEDKAFIGIGAMLVAPVKIGKGAKVGAGSVVTKNKNVAPGETVAGVPARPLKAKKRG